MRKLTRSEWYTEKISDFLEHPKTNALHIILYSREIRKVEKMFPEIEVCKGPFLSEADRRFNCIITVKSELK